MPRHKSRAAIVRAAGRVSSPAKTAAARRNARLGGRPAKFAIGDRVRANATAPRSYAGRQGAIAAVGPAKNDYAVRFDAAPALPDRGQMKSWWIDRA